MDARNEFFESKGPGRAVVGHPGRHHLYQVALAYQEAGWLESFVTTRFVGTKARLRLGPLGLLSKRVRKALQYSSAAIEGRALVAREGFAARVAFRALGVRVFPGTWRDAMLNEARSATLVHLPCMNAGEIFQRLAGTGKQLCLDQYIGDRRRGRALLMGEADALGLQPGPDAFLGFSDADIEKNEREYTLADRIVAGSRFVEATLVEAGVAREKIVLAEYGADLSAFPYVERTRRPSDEFRVAMVGTGFVRKGMLRTIRAARRTRGVKIHIFGGTHDVPDPSEFEDVAVFHGHVPRVDLVRLLARCHAFALPSVWEGSAYAIGEAMASGLPVIVTPNAGSWARHETDGFVVPVGGEEEIALAFERLRDEELRVSMARSARENAEVHSWETFRRAIRAGCLGDGREANAPA